MTDAERQNLMMRYEILVDKVRIKSLTNYEADLLTSLERIIGKYATTEDLTDLQRRRVLTKAIIEELGPIYKDLGDNLLEDMAAGAAAYGSFIMSTYNESPIDKALKFNSKTLIQNYELGDMIKSNKDDMIKGYKVLIAEGLTEGQHSTTVARNMRKKMGKTYAHVSQVTVQASMAEARKQAMYDTYGKLVDQGIVNGFKWDAMLEMRTCPVCQALDQTRYKTIEAIPPFKAHFRCLVGGSLISTRNLEQGNELIRIYRRRYQGTLYAVTTSKGNTITMTPNHPVMTSRGFEAAQALRVGDYIATDIQNNSDTSIEVLYSKYSKIKPTHTYLTEPDDFHGDVTDLAAQMVTVNTNGTVEELSDDELFTKLCEDEYGVEVGYLEIDSIEIFESDCYVYNLETKFNYYVANGIISHNCRCQIIPLTDMYTPKKRAATMYYETPDGIKKGGTYLDSLSYKDWLKLQPESVQAAIASPKHKISKGTFDKLMKSNYVVDSPAT